MIAGVKQNYARRCHIPIDAITFDYTCMPADTHPDSAPAEGGAYVNGMFVEGARWDHATAKLEESQPKVGIDKALYSVVWSCLQGCMRVVVLQAVVCLIARTFRTCCKVLPPALMTS